MSQETGRAYGIFYCSSPKEKIEAELPTIRELVKTPSQLELALFDCVESVTDDKKLIAIIQEAKHRTNYILQATYPDRTNKDAADELAAILNQAYNSYLYEDRQLFKGAIIYKDNGRYVPRE